MLARMSWRLDPRRTGLLIIDIQERLVPAISGSAAVVRKVAAAAAVARQFAIPSFLTEQVPDKLGCTVAPVLDALGPDGPPARKKCAFSAAGCFAPHELPTVLLVAGVETHVCVRQTVFDLRERAHTIYLLADAIGSRSETDHRLAIHEMREIAGARVTTVESVAWELLGSAEGEAFKALLTLLK